MKATPKIFDRERFKKNKSSSYKEFSKYDFIYKISSESIQERIQALGKKFQKAFVYGDFIGEVPCCENVIYANIVGGPDIKECDEEFLDIPEESYDLIISNLSLHFVNDVKGVLQRYLKLLKPGGYFIGIFIGGYSFHELRELMKTADLKFFNGISSRFIPMIDVKDAGKLLQLAGFNMPIADSESINLQYDSVLRALRDIKGMGQGLCLSHNSNKPLFKSYLKFLDQNIAQNGVLNLKLDLIGVIGLKAK